MYNYKVLGRQSWKRLGNTVLFGKGSNAPVRMGPCIF